MIDIFLNVLSEQKLQIIREWRNQEPETTRTPHMLTDLQQKEYYENIICNRDSKTRYWAIEEKENKKDLYSYKNYTLYGYGGIENIQWENGLGEISILINPMFRGQGIGCKAVELFLENAFGALRLKNVWGECYKCSPAIKFWDKIIKQYNAFSTILPNRKYFKGIYFDSLYFNFNKKDFING